MKGKFFKMFRLLETLFLDIFFIKQDFNYQTLKTQHFLRENNTCYYLLPYKNKHVRNAFWSLKFRRNKKIARYFGILLADYIPELLAEKLLLENFDKPLFVTVPVSKKTYLERGFDHNALIMKSLLNSMELPANSYFPDLLKKVRHTKRQSRTSSRAERLTNQSGAFKINKKYLSLLKKRNIVLVDDIMTTGATINEVEKILKNASANKIIKIVIAH